MVKNYLKWEVHSLDPIHIFASFNYPGIDRELRIKKLRLYFRLLGSELEYENINFKGSIELVPSYLVINIVHLIMIINLNYILTMLVIQRK
jgi:hypothetical protein